MRTLVYRTLVGGMLLLCGCQGFYYGTMEKLGHHKRDLLVDRVQDARDAQQDAKKQFQSALEQFRAVVNLQGGELEKTYKKLKAELDRSEKRAKAVHKRISDVEKVAKALFKEWERELGQYSNEELRLLSRQKLELTQQRYARLISTMHSAKRRITPVLTAFRDQVLFLKHNLNAQAIASLQDELASVETSTASLIREMEASIKEANTFIEVMEQK